MLRGAWMKLCLTGHSHLTVCVLSCRPGGELSPGEDEVEGLKRLMTEVTAAEMILITYK